MDYVWSSGICSFNEEANTLHAVPIKSGALSLTPSLSLSLSTVQGKVAGGNEVRHHSLVKMV